MRSANRHARPRHRVLRPIFALALALALAAPLAACEQGSGVITGDTLTVAGCHGVHRDETWTPFRMDLVFLGLEDQKDAVIVRLSSSDARVGTTDSFAFLLPSARDAREGLAAHGTLTLPFDPVHVRASLTLLDRCAITTPALIASGGAVTLTRFGTKKGDRVTGTLAFDLVDERTGELVGTGFRGDFDFDVIHGLPHTPFSARDY